MNPNPPTPGLLRKLRCGLLALAVAVLAAGCTGGQDQREPAAGPAATPDGILEVIARTGPIVQVQVGEMTTLDGSRSFSSSAEPLTFSWSFSHKPDASNAELQSATTASPSFVPDAAGTYMAQLVVSAEGVPSQRSMMVVVATAPPDQSFFHHGLSSLCAGCHSDEFVDIPAKSLNHLATSNICATCHSPTPVGFSVIPYVDHLEVFGNCSECHNGILAIGKSEFHLPTVAECNDCHTTSNFLQLALDGSFDHSGVSGSCNGCHNGRVAKGKTPTPPHPDTIAECGACHTTVSFQGAFPDHTGPLVVGKRCDSCHGVTATGPSDGHPVTFVDCATCHRIATFSMGGVFNHHVVDPSVQPCESCHNDNNSINAPGKSSAVGGHPVTTADCGNCHNTDSFTGAFTDHSGIVDNCASCHGVTASGKSPNHMPTVEDCSVCHSPGTFATGTYDHAGVVNNCESCHNTVISVGKRANHLPTTADCSVCHDTVDFAGAQFDHVGIDVNNCAACHDGWISIGKSRNHLPTSLDCSSCHDINNFTSFAGITFNHLGIDPNNCATCHNTGIATPKKINHIPAEAECSVCHDSTVTFTSTTFLITTHPGIDRGCEGCHTGKFFPANPNVVKAVDHLPTVQDCYNCHTTTAFVPSIFSHAGISGNCESCHDGSPNHVALGARGKTPAPVHQNTSGDCSVCHNTVSFADAFVDHASTAVLGSRCDSCHNGIDATGKDAKPNHVVTNEDCKVCHVPGGTFSPAVFDHTGIVANCASCHNGIDATGKDAKMNPAHIPTNQDCSVCHIPTSFANARFDHQGIVGNCTSCHDGNTATGKANRHVPTNADCSNCHVTTGFVPATFDHIGIVDNCASCHDAGFATPKSTDHVATNQDCGVCHNTRNFIPATFDHTGIVDNCASCHGVSAIGMSPNHIPTVLDCSSCHTTAGFAGARFDHQGITDGCGSCHDGTIAIGNTPQGLNDHFVTLADCGACHFTRGWAPIDYTHPPGSGYPGDHNGNIGCRSCHTDNDANITYRSPRYAPFCAGCHENNFKSEGAHIGGKGGTVEQNKDCSGGGRGCHKVSDRNFD